MEVVQLFVMDAERFDKLGLKLHSNKPKFNDPVYISLAYWRAVQQTLLIIRLALRGYVENNECSTATLDVCRKQIKQLRSIIPKVKILEDLDMVLYQLVELSGKKDMATNQYENHKVREIKVAGILITNGKETMEEFRNNMIKAAWTISYYLAPNWETEFMKLGREIDSFFSKEYALTMHKLLNDFT